MLGPVWAPSRSAPWHADALGAVERAEASLDVVEAVAEFVELQRANPSGVRVVTDPPQGPMLPKLASGDK